MTKDELFAELVKALEEAHLVLIDPAGYTQDTLDALDKRIVTTLSYARTVQSDEWQDITFLQFSKANRERCESPTGFKHPLSGWSTSDWMTAILGELGEAANVVKKLNRVRDSVPGNKQTPEQLRTMLRRELGDVFVYLDLLCQSLNFHIADAAVEVFNAKSSEIGYTGTPLPSPPKHEETPK